MQTSACKTDPELLRGFRRNLRSIERALVRGLKDKNGSPGCCGVSLAQCHALLAIPSEGSELTELGKELGVEPSTLTRTLDGLERQGLIRREADPKDRRGLRAIPSAQGMAKVGEIDLVWGSWLCRILDRLPEEKRPLVLEGVGLLAEALREQEGENPCC
jgi:DNA-binding MarR family transcriptional regulator